LQVYKVGENVGLSKQVLVSFHRVGGLRGTYEAITDSEVRYSDEPNISLNNTNLPFVEFINLSLKLFLLSSDCKDSFQKGKKKKLIR
jgi:hypothetical protein